MTNLFSFILYIVAIESGWDMRAWIWWKLPSKNNSRLYIIPRKIKCSSIKERIFINYHAML